jgi:Holliday junction resolvase
MTHYANGRSFEYRVMDDLSVSGWVSVRAAGSKGSTKADIIAFHPTRGIMLVQCKTNGIISAEEWNRLYEVAGWNDGVSVAVIAERPKRGKIAYWAITGQRVPYKPSVNRIEYFPHVDSGLVALDN